jgi:hypothetical protein
MIEIDQGITIGQGIQIGDRPVFLVEVFLLTESGDNLITQALQNFIEETI